MDLLAANVEEEEEEPEGEEDEGGEPEDDFNAAWEVLDLARAIFEKGGDPAKIRLGDVHVALGDISLETGTHEWEAPSPGVWLSDHFNHAEKFDQAIIDFTAAVKYKTEVFPVYSRQLAEAHYKLSMALDLTPGQLGGAIEHAGKALDSVEARLSILRDAAGGNLVISQPASNGKGKGKEKALLEDDLMKSIESMSKEALEEQIKEFEELRTDLILKVRFGQAIPSSA